MTKKKIGIIGGMGSRAGCFFLKKIMDYSPAETDQEFPEIIFHNNSSVPDRTKAILYNQRSPIEELLKSVELFNNNKVEIISISCITSYFYYDQICRHTNAIVINPLNLVAEYVLKNNNKAKRIGVLATTGTINTKLFHKAFSNSNVEIITLNPADQEEIFMRAVYMKNGYKSSVISVDAIALMNKSFQMLKNLDVDMIIGGCTEVSISTRPKEIDVPYVDMLDLLARKTVDYCYNLQ